MFKWRPGKLAWLKSKGELPSMAEAYSADGEAKELYLLGDLAAHEEQDYKGWCRLKAECVQQQQLRDFAGAQREINRSIEWYYSERSHESVEYLNLREFREK